MSPGRRQAIAWTNAGILLIGALGTNFNEILIEIYIFFQSRKSIWKCRLEPPSGKWWPLCLGLTVRIGNKSNSHVNENWNTWRMITLKPNAQTNQWGLSATNLNYHCIFGSCHWKLSANFHRTNNPFFQVFILYISFRVLWRQSIFNCGKYLIIVKTFATFVHLFFQSKYIVKPVYNDHLMDTSLPSGAHLGGQWPPRWAQKAEIVSKSKLVPSVFIKTHYWINHR